MLQEGIFSTYQHDITLNYNTCIVTRIVLNLATFITLWEKGLTGMIIV